MKVLIVAQNPFWPENADGVNKILYHLMVNNSYFQADYLSLFKGSIPPPTACTTNSRILNLNMEKPNISKFVSKLKWFFSPYPYLSQIKRKHLIALKNFLLENHDRYDVIQITGFQISRVIPLLPEKVVKKIHFLAIDSPSLLFSSRFDNESNILKKIIWKLETLKAKSLEKTIYSLAKKNIFVSDKDLNHVKEEFPNSVFIPNGVDIEKFYYKPISESDRNTLVFTGNFDYAPNIEVCHFLVNEVYPLLLKKNPDIKLVLAGNSPSQELMKLAPDGVTYTGFVESMVDELHKYAIFVSPIFFGAGIKNKILEAMSTGRIVIGSKLSFDGISCLDQKNCIILDTKSKDEWAKSILKILHDTENLDEISKNATKIIKFKYSWEQTRENYLKSYHE